MHTIKRVGRVRFQQESSGSLEVVRAMHVPKLNVNLLLGYTLMDEGYEVGFRDGTMLIRSERANTRDVQRSLASERV